MGNTDRRQALNRSAGAKCGPACPARNFWQYHIQQHYSVAEGVRSPLEFRALREPFDTVTPQIISELAED
jgi:hypothetical protein